MGSFSRPSPLTSRTCAPQAQERGRNRPPTLPPPSDHPHCKRQLQGPPAEGAGGPEPPGTGPGWAGQVEGHLTAPAPGENTLFSVQSYSVRQGICPDLPRTLPSVAPPARSGLLGAEITHGVQSQQPSPGAAAAPLTSPNIGVVGGRNRLQFPSQNFAAINAIEARVAVKDFEATGCAENPDATQARARISGFFFTLPNPRLPGNFPTPVLADIRIERRSDSTDHPRVLQVLSVLFHCDDPSCVLGQIFESFPLGTIRQWESAELFIQWDQATQTWTARRDDLVVERVLLDAGPFAGAKRLEISPNVANCPSPPRGVSHMDVLFNNVRITAPPAPSP